VTASASLKESGTANSWVSWATSPAVDHPPPVSAQKPVWMPGARCPKAVCSQSPVRPTAHAGQGGSIPRARQPSTGWITTREPAGNGAPSAPVASSSSVPVTSWPGTNGKLTRGSK